MPPRLLGPGPVPTRADNAPRRRRRACLEAPDALRVGGARQCQPLAQGGCPCGWGSGHGVCAYMRCNVCTHNSPQPSTHCRAWRPLTAALVPPVMPSSAALVESCGQHAYGAHQGELHASCCKQQAPCWLHEPNNPNPPRHRATGSDLRARRERPKPSSARLRWAQEVSAQSAHCCRVAAACCAR